MLVLALPWVKTKLNFNLTCYLMGLHEIHKKLGFIPRNFSTFFDRGDENVSKYAMGFWGIMVKEGVLESALMSANPVGHSHNLGDGENTAMMRLQRGVKRSGQRVGGPSPVIVRASHP